MKYPMQVTSIKEIQNKSTSYAYQIKQRTLNIKYYKVLVLHHRPELEKEVEGLRYPYSVSVRYYTLPYDNIPFRTESFTFIGHFRNFNEAMNRIRNMIKKNGTGSRKEWEKFYNARTRSRRLVSSLPRK